VLSCKCPGSRPNLPPLAIIFLIGYSSWMTTIVYKEGIIAYDSRLTQADTIVSDKYNKLFKKKGVRFILAGAECDFEKFIDFYFVHRSEEKIPINDVKFSCEGFIVDTGKLYIGECEPGQGYWTSKCKLNEHWALGAGCDFALGAMDAGASAIEALRIAKSRNTLTGGKLRSIKVI